MNSFNKYGHLVIDQVYTATEIEKLSRAISAADTKNDNFRKTNDLFAIRQFLKEMPQLAPLVFNGKIKQVIAQNLGADYFVVRSIYFDKPPLSNWAVPWHQDITISVNERQDIAGFTGWTIKQDQYSVCPPAFYMQNICTLRIHLDDTDAGNGALKVLSASHLQGIKRTNEIQIEKEKIAVCNVPRGGVMLMKPLLFHSSDKTTGDRRRRVIHIEMSNVHLPEGLSWSEKMLLPA